MASGGLDGNVKFWDTTSISANLKDSSDANKASRDLSDSSEPIKRALCTASRHNGAVTCVKFSPDGNYLATGSDDKIVLIWERDLHVRTKQFGDAEADLEHWTVRKRLVAHDNDVQDMCWSPDGSLLVTVGLDRLIIIWSGVTFERIKRYDIHQSMVKGVIFDPANKFFATASDDRTVRIFRYYRKQSENSYEFQIEHVVIDPFRKSPLTSYFRRMTWSPDGQHIAVPNATNGPVTSVAIINRGDWGADVSLIGHEAPCEVCSFAPRLFSIGDSKDANANISAILATGGQDRTLAIWSTANSKPLLVAQNVVQEPITDICWSPSADSLYISSLDGSITFVAFDKNELGTLAGTDVSLSQLHRYGGDRESAILPETVEQLLLEEKAGPMNETQNDNEKMKELTTITNKPLVSNTTSKIAVTSDVGKGSTKDNLQKQKVTTKDGKKRIAPLLVSSSNNTSLLPASSPLLSFDQKRNTRISRPNYSLPRLGVQSAIHGMRSKNNKSNEESNEMEDQDNDNDDMAVGMDMQTDSSANVSAASLKRQKTKIKRAAIEKRYPYALRNVSLLPDCLFNDQAAMNDKVSSFFGLGFEQTTAKAPVGDHITSSAVELLDDEFLFEVLVRTFQTERLVEGMSVIDKVTIEVRNGASWPQDDEYPIDEDNRIDFQDPTIVNVTSSLNAKERLFQLYYPFKIQHIFPIIEGTETFILLISLQGTIQVLSYPSGLNVSPPIELAETIILLQYRNGHLMIVTSSGLVYVWRFASRLFHSVLSQVSVATVINSSVSIPESTAQKRTRKLTDAPQVKIPLVQSLELGEDGLPYILLEDGSAVFRYSVDLMAWTKVVEPWFFHVVDDIPDKQESTRSYLLARGYENFRNAVTAGIIKRYTFEEHANELKLLMEQRYNEQYSL